jgi:hypothetical protein
MLLDSFTRIMRALDLARDLNEPGEVNEEYARGQVNLIVDMAGLPFGMDNYGGAFTAYITHGVTRERMLFLIAGSALTTGQ